MMHSLASRLRSIIFIAALGLPDAAAAQSTVSLSLPQARQLAANLLFDGQPAASLEIADGLIAANADDRTALIIRAGALRALQRPTEARRAAARAYRLSDTPLERYEAARLAAVANADEERFSWAQFWLRLARENAPNQEEANRVAAEYQQLRRLNPWTFDASFGVAPSANINGGTNEERIFVPENQLLFTEILANSGLNGLIQFDPDTQTRRVANNQRALSGIEANLTFGAQYRLRETESSATFVSSSLNFNRYRLSEEAQELSPTSTSSDFSRDSLSFGIRHIQTLSEGMRPASFSFGIGKNWYGGSQSNRFATASFSQPFLMSNTDLLTLGVTAGVSASFRDDIPVRTFGVNARLLSILPTRDRIQTSVGVTKSRSSIADSDYTAFSAGVSYSFAQPIFTAGVTLHSNAQFSNIGATQFAPFDREDTTISVGADISLPRAEVFGFQPVVTLLAEQTYSTVDQFDSEGTSIGLDFRSSF